MIEAPLLANVLDRVAAQPGLPDELLLAGLRESFAGLHLSLCRDDDVPPLLGWAAENAYCRLYYVTRGDHCLSLTSDAAAASGLVIALLDEDEA